MVKLIGMLSQLNPLRVLVMGDFMLDTYTSGKVKRISPEAPVSILHVQKEENRPGGAGNVVLNLVALGASVIAVGRIGRDFAGETLCEVLEEEGVDVQSLLIQKDFRTPVKNRLIADSQQILRVDAEMISPIPEELEQVIADRIPFLLEQVEIVAVSDYGKGFLSRYLLSVLIKRAREKKIPVIIDPKGNDFSRYEGATVIKPNVSEAYEAAKLPQDTPLEQVASMILKNNDIEMLLITRSEAGISLFYKNGEVFDFPVRSKEVKDVTGAGDTVLAIISLALGNGLDIKYAAQLANIAAGIAIERLGCARIYLSELAERLLELDVDNKVFDEEHLFALKQALKGKRFVVLGLSSDKGMSTALFRSIRMLSSRLNSEEKLIVYLRDDQPDEEFVSMLASLKEVDFIVLKCDSLIDLCAIIQPHEVLVLENEVLITLDDPQALLLG